MNPLKSFPWQTLDLRKPSTVVGFGFLVLLAILGGQLRFPWDGINARLEKVEASNLTIQQQHGTMAEMLRTMQEDLLHESKTQTYLQEKAVNYDRKQCVREARDDREREECLSI